MKYYGDDKLTGFSGNKKQEVIMKTKVQKKPYQGKPKVAAKRSVSGAPTFKKPYSKANKLSTKPEFPPCRVCNDGVLRPTQWNRIVCSSNKCMNSELA